MVDKDLEEIVGGWPRALTRAQGAAHASDRPQTSSNSHDPSNGQRPRSVVEVLTDLRSDIASGAVNEYQPTALGFHAT